MYPILVSIAFLFLAFKYIKKMLSVNVLLTLILTVVFFNGIFEQFNIPQIYINLLVEVMVWILFYLSLQACKLNNRKFYTPLIKIVLIFSFIVLISALLNYSNKYQVLLYYRFFLSPYILFLFIFNYYFTEKQTKTIIDYLIFLFIFQIVATIIKLLVMGTPEHPVGSIIVAGGGVATHLPLIAAGFLLSFYFLYEKKYVYIGLLLLFQLIAYASQKRGTFIFFPIIALFLAYFLGKIEYTSTSLYKKGRYYILGGSLALVILVVGAKYNWIMNPDAKIGGSFDLNFLIESSVDYNTKEGEYSFGRVASFNKINHVLMNSDLFNTLFGFGPSSVKGAERDDGSWEKFGVNGTYPGITYQFVQVGLLGGLVLLLFYIQFGKRVYRALKYEKDKYWKSIGMGTLVFTLVIVIDYLTYSITFYTTYALTFSYICVTGFLMKRQYRKN